VLENTNILLGVAGGVAAYKSVDLASKLTAAGACVQTVMTESACHFVTPKNFEAVTAAAVFTSLWNSAEAHRSAHISLADWADMVVVAPATANSIGKAAHGLCDDLLSTTLCTSWATPTLLAPAMNTRMWENPAVQRNVETLKQRGVRIIGPVAGRLACGTQGIGRMAEPADIVKAIEGLVANPGQEL